MNTKKLEFSINNCPTSWVVVKWLLSDKALSKMLRKYLEKTDNPCYYDFLRYYELEGILTPDDHPFDARGIDFDEVDNVFEILQEFLYYETPILSRSGAYWGYLGGNGNKK